MTFAGAPAHGYAKRRTVLAALGASITVPMLPRPAHAAPLTALDLFGPPAGPSITLAHAAASGALSAVADRASFTAWRNPDELRAGLSSGTMSTVVMPVQVAANLYNRGFGIRLVNVMTNGLLYVISTDPGITSFDGLRGKRLAVPFRNDTPDLILRRLLDHQAMDAGSDLTVETTGTPIEAMQMLLAGRTDAALVPEPAASAAIVRGAVSGIEVHRAIDIQAAWGEITGLGAALPQAGLAVTEEFRQRNSNIVDALHQALEDATAAVIADPPRAANDAAAALNLPWPVIEAAIPFSNLVAIRAAEARPTIDAMLSTLSEADPETIGGGLPDAGLYL